MNKFLTIALSLLMLSATYPQEVNVNKSFAYSEYGIGPLPYPIPNIGVGNRNQMGKHGFDVNINFFTHLEVSHVCHLSKTTPSDSTSSFAE